MNQHHETDTRSRAAGFTIVELLVVVTIIIMMLVLILPTYETAVERAEIVACQANQRQIYGAMLAYTSDNLFFLPGDRWATDTNNNWGQWHTGTLGNRRIAPYTDASGKKWQGSRLWPYLGDEGVFLCPTFARIAVGLVSDPRHKPANSYSMVENVWRGWQGQPEIHKLVHDPYVRLPDKHMLLADEPPYKPTAAANYTINNSWLGVSSNFKNPAHKIDGVASYHLPFDKKFWAGNGNVLFFDGHSELTVQKEALDSKKLAFPEKYQTYLVTP